MHNLLDILIVLDVSHFHSFHDPESTAPKGISYAIHESDSYFLQIDNLLFLPIVVRVALDVPMDSSN